MLINLDTNKKILKNDLHQNCIIVKKVVLIKCFKQKNWVKFKLLFGWSNYSGCFS